MDTIINLGPILDDVIDVVDINYDLRANNSNTALIANMRANIYNKNKPTPDRIILEIHLAQFWLIPAESYDLIVFASLRAMFGLEFPRLGIVTYYNQNYILMKRFGDRELEEKDYWPHNTKNFRFRFNLALIVYFCRLIGCPFQLKDVRVLKGIPFYWKCRNLGYRNTTTVSSEEFYKIFGIDLETLKTGAGNCMARAVIKYFREIDFDTDILRGILYVKDSEIRYKKGVRVKYPLTRRPKIVEELIEENYSLLIGEFPYKIFNSSIGRPKQDLIWNIAAGRIK
jgi:hypothetical protein